MVLTYVVIFAAVPLFYTVVTVINLPDIIECKNNTWNQPTCKAFIYNETLNDELAKGNIDEKWSLDEIVIYQNLPSYEYFRHHMNVISNEFEDETKISKSFNRSILLCALIIWAFVYFLHSRGIEWLGRINRYVTLTLLFILSIFIVKAFCTKELLRALRSSFDSRSNRPDNHIQALIAGPTLCIQLFGRGWGTILAMGSHNQFRTNLTKHTLVLVLMNFLISFGCSFVTFAFYGILAEVTFHGLTDNNLHPLEKIFVVVPAVFGNLGSPRLFLFLFFLMLTLAETFGIAIQLSSLLSSLFDEHDKLRHSKREISIGFVLFFIFTTIFYCSGLNNNFFFAITQFTIPTHVLMFLLFILVVFWIYGRERFQRDVHFMLEIRFHTALVYMVRFLTPIVCLLVLLIFGTDLIDNIAFTEFIVAFLLRVLPMLVIPGYMIFALTKTKGPLSSRIRKLNRPTDWYPVDREEKRKYEEALGQMVEPLAQYGDDLL
ncbi:hypothetical protein ACFFRR_004861 [Megaselia abdita]